MQIWNKSLLFVFFSFQDSWHKNICVYRKFRLSSFNESHNSRTVGMGGGGFILWFIFFPGDVTSENSCNSLLQKRIRTLVILDYYYVMQIWSWFIRFYRPFKCSWHKNIISLYHVNSFLVILIIAFHSHSSFFFFPSNTFSLFKMREVLSKFIFFLNSPVQHRSSFFFYPFLSLSSFYIIFYCASFSLSPSLLTNVNTSPCLVS